MYSELHLESQYSRSLCWRSLPTCIYEHVCVDTNMDDISCHYIHTHSHTYIHTYIHKYSNFSYEWFVWGSLWPTPIRLKLWKVHKQESSYTAIIIIMLLKWKACSLVPRPIPSFQCCKLKCGRAWYQKSHDFASRWHEDQQSKGCFENL